jgi:Icc protein
VAARRDGAPRRLRRLDPRRAGAGAVNRFLLAQVTDMHIKAGGKLSYRVVDTEGSLARCVAHLLRLPQVPDAVLFTGDLTDFGRPEEYDNLARLLQPLTMPVFLMAGNHDDPELMRRTFPRHGYLRQRSGHLDYVIDDFAVRIVALDSTVPQQSGGELRASQLQWLDETLRAAAAKPTIVAVHHPPFWTGIGHMDKIGFANPAALEAVIARHPQVERVVSGHVHRTIVKRFGGTIASTCPSPSHQVALDLADDAASRFVMEPPGFQLHLWREGAGIVSHTGAVGEFAGPYPFYEGGVLID